MSQPEDHRKPAALQVPVYAVAFFNGSLFIMLSVIMPLWALELDASPVVIGLIISSRQLLVLVLAVHGGALLDRFGPRNVIAVFGVAGAAVMALFPVFPVVPVVVVLQMVSGFLETTSWIGAQALVGRLLGGHPVYAGRMTASARVGSFAGPAVIGLVWQFFGPGPAFWLAAVWIFCGGAAALFLPRDRGTEHAAVETAAPPGDGSLAQPNGGATRRVGVLPKLSDYSTTFRLLVLPAVALVIAVTFMRQTGSGIQSSFYGVWLKEAGFEAGTIGLLLGISNAVSAASALCVGPLARRIAGHWLLIGATALAVASIAITPMLAGFLAFAAAISLRGIGQGLNFPLMLSIASRAVGAHLQGRVIALRISFNRLGGALVPLAMGAIAEVVGLENAFYVIGAFGLLLLALLGAWVSRSPQLPAGNKG